jgi:hypothetical protein
MNASNKWEVFGTIIFSLFVFFMLGSIIIGIYHVSSILFSSLLSINPQISTAIIAAVATIIVATLTVVLGRYFERRKEIEAHFRAEKIKIYDEFLKEFFAIFHAADDVAKVDDARVVQFLRDWQRKIILWGGQDILKAYIEWTTNLKSGSPSAKSMFLTEALFKALRKDIGQRHWKLPQGSFIRILLRNPDIFLEAAKKNPNISLTEIAALEVSIEESKNKRV